MSEEVLRSCLLLQRLQWMLQQRCTWRQLCPLSDVRVTKNRFSPQEKSTLHLGMSQNHSTQPTAEHGKGWSARQPNTSTVRWESKLCLTTDTSTGEAICQPNCYSDIDPCCHPCTHIWWDANKERQNPTETQACTDADNTVKHLQNLRRQTGKKRHSPQPENVRNRVEDSTWNGRKIIHAHIPAQKVTDRSDAHESITWSWHQ